MKKKQKWTVFSVLGLLILLLFAAICIAPFIYMTIMSFTQSTTLMLHWSDINFGDFTNFNYVLKKTGFIRALTNSVIVVFCSCLFNCIIASMAAYGFAKKKFPGSKAIFRIYLLTLMIPGQVTMIPVFIDTVPDELLEAAKVDGCPEYRIFIQIVIPLIKPVLISLVVFTFVTSWNDFLWPLVSTSNSDMYTLTVALSLLKTQYQTNYGLIMAGATVSFLFPFIMYVFLQKQFVEGIALSGIKG